LIHFYKRSKMEQQKKTKKSKPKANQKDIEDAVPPHILNIVMGVDKKSKRRKKEEKNREQGMDSIALLRNMMSSVRTKCELSEAAEDDRRAKEKDMKMISNARDIFKTLETNEGVEEEVSREKVKRVEVKPDFLLSGQNKAEEMRLERIRELQAMKIARERELEEEERMRSMEMNRENLIKRQRENEMEMMRMARQQAMEEEEQRQQMEAANQRAARQISPGLAAARQGLKIDARDHEEDRVERMRYERERELNEMRKARARQEFEQEDNYRQEKSDASKELEAFRASQQTSNTSNP